MNTAEIEKQIQDERVKYGSSLYPNPVPKDLIELFKKALFSVPIGQMVVKNIRLSLSKKTKELTRNEVGLMVNHILKVEPDKLFKDLQTALDKYEELQQLIFDYNIQNSKKEEELTERRLNLYQLSGHGNKLSLVN